MTHLTPPPTDQHTPFPRGTHPSHPSTSRMTPPSVRLKNMTPGPVPRVTNCPSLLKRPDTLTTPVLPTNWVKPSVKPLLLRATQSSLGRWKPHTKSLCSTRTKQLSTCPRPLSLKAVIILSYPPKLRTPCTQERCTSTTNTLRRRWPLPLELSLLSVRP